MPCYVRMKTIYLRGLLWLYLLGFRYMALSLEPGFLDFDNLPDTNFSCVGKVIGGYYADLETNCQMFHVCTIGQLDEPMDIRFLCLNGTVFDQETRVCERIDEVDCSKSEQFYSLNLELYGNTQPSILEENPSETDPPIVIKSTTTTTTTTTSKPKTTRAQFFTTSAQPVTTITHPKVISTHHFPISNQPDIRFNPEEINISLNPGAPPNIRHRPVSFQQVFEEDTSTHINNKKAIVTTHPNKQEIIITTLKPSSTQKPKTIVNYDLTHDKNPVTPADINYGFTYRQTESSNQQYHTEIPQNHNYQYHHQNYPPAQYRNQHLNQYRTSTYSNQHIPATTRRTYNSHSGPTTFRNPYYRTEKPQRLQLPLPLLPTLPPLTFSSPAPFSINRHIETKRYTNEHQTPPRIIISASASVSDASGRRLNYSLGTIGVTPLLEEPPKSYDDYKDHDVVLDPFYHDVPKIKEAKRKKREAEGVKHSDVIKSDQEAVDVLKFLFDWYKNQEKSSTSTQIPLATEINQELAPVSEDEITEDFRESELFKRKSKFNIVGDVLSVTEKESEMPTSTPESDKKFNSQDYVDDNYEPQIYKESDKNETDFKSESSTHVEEVVNSTDVAVTTESIVSTTVISSTTTTRPKIRRRGRGRYFSENPSTPAPIKEDAPQLVKSINQEIAAIFTDSEPSTPKTRRRGRGRFSIVSSTTEVDPFEDLEGAEEAISARVEQVTLETIKETAVDEKGVSEVETPVSSATEENVNDNFDVTETSSAFPTPDIKSEDQNSENVETSSAFATPEESADKKPQHEISENIETSSALSTSDIKSEDENSENVETSSAFAAPEESVDKKPEDENSENIETSSALSTPDIKSEDEHSENVETSSAFAAPEESVDKKPQDENSENIETSSSVLPTHEETLVSSTSEATIEHIQENEEPESRVSTSETVATTLPNVEEETPINEKIELEHAYVHKELEDEILDSQIPDEENIETTPFVINRQENEEHKEIEISKPKIRSRGRGRSRFQEQEIVEEKNTESVNKEVTNKTDEEPTTKAEIATKETLYDVEEHEEHQTIEDKEHIITTEEASTESLYDLQGHEEILTTTQEEFITPQTTSTTPKPLVEEIVEEVLTPKPRRRGRGRYHALHRHSQNSSNEIIDTTQTSIVTETPKIKTTIESITATSQTLIEDHSKEQDELLEVTTLGNLVETTETTSIGVSNSETDHLVTSESTLQDLEPSTTVAPVNLTPGEEIITTTSETPLTSTRRRRIRPGKASSENRRHRFSTELFTSRPDRRKPVIEEEIIGVLTGLTTDKSGTTVKIYSTPKEIAEEVAATDAPLFKSANPTQAETTKENLHTTPLSMMHDKTRKNYIFNCFRRELDKFYSDPRDCRLFHYCTSGYTKNQLLDMKFVCDLGTYFDEEKLICTKVKPGRCL